MTGLYRKIRKVVFVIAFIFLLLFFLYQILFKPVLDLLVSTDVAKRIESPDHTKTALLIRRYAFDLNFIVKVKEDSKAKTLFHSKDFIPDPSVDWKEQLIWSDDSSFIVMTVEEPIRPFSRDSQTHKYIWAYDFKDNKIYEGCNDESTMEYYNVNTIIRILNSRSKKDKMDLIKLSNEP